MDNLREPGHAQDIRSQSDRRASLIDSLDYDRGSRHETDLRDLTGKQEKQSKRRALHTSTFTASVDGLRTLKNDLVLFYGGLHLPEESEIGSVYVENYSEVDLNIFEGPGGSGRIIGIVPASCFRILSIADGISSVSVVITAPNGNAQGLVIVTLFSHKWAPKQGNIAITPTTTPGPPNTNPVSQAGTAIASGQIYAPPNNKKLHLSFAMITARAPVPAGEFYALQADTNNLLTVTPELQTNQASFASPFIVAQDLSISFEGFPAQPVDWAITGYTG